MTTRPLRRLWASGETLWVGSLTHLDIYEKNQGIQRWVKGDVEFNRMSNVVLAVAPEKERVWVGRGAQREVEKFGPENHPPRVFTLTRGLDTPVTPLEVELADLVCDGERLIGCQVDGRPGLASILWSDLSASAWQTMPLPEPVVGVPCELFPPEEGVEGDPSGVLLSTHLHGVVAVDPGSGLIAVIRPGSSKVDFVLKLAPARLKEQWFAVPTRKGVLLGITRNGTSSALLHYTEDGRLTDELNMQEDTSVRGLALADEDTALVVMKRHLALAPVSPELTISEMVPVDMEDTFRFATATAAPGRVWIAPDYLDYGWIAQVRCEAGKPPELWKFKAPLAQGEPLWDYGCSRPRLDWEDASATDTMKRKFSVPLASSSTWRQRFRNVGTEATGLRLLVGGRPLGADAVTVRVRLNGEELVPASHAGDDMRFEHRMSIPPGATGELEVTVHGQQMCSGLVAVSLAPWTPSKYLPAPESLGGMHSEIYSFLELSVVDPSSVS
ncbi:hypothetical protein [Vitiosangium sp. GDMCC 1.1324]|uniref:hypothetical protein n=1 Tax=Vitiosangium sp. (strain GDMCC 1.1324) TaxID=2138576 RepID=UPI000D36F6CC|nr:hypothetical protein [Vitiosangium sp. GDMCC 1.1324]PTL79974.1 hypothetical protein DAT35_31630 [Vitiosangium sp. GDMCC 1.1324]